MKCTHCGVELPENAKFCPRCAHAVPGAIANQPTVSAVTAANDASNKTLLTIVIIVFGSLFFLAVLGVLSSVVLVSLNSARSKGKESMVRNTLMSIRPMLEQYYSQNGSSYSNADHCYQGAFLDQNIAPYIASLNEYSPVCISKSGSYAMTAKLISTKEDFCVDYKGYGDVGKIVNDKSGVYCAPAVKVEE